MLFSRSVVIVCLTVIVEGRLQLSGASYSTIHKAPGLKVPGHSMICLVLFHHFTIPTMKPSMGEWPLGVIPAASIFGNGW